jgi:citrate lyase subunit beta / citryl-CoA lyase
MMETPMGMLNAAEIAASGGRLQLLVMGTSDLISDLRGRPQADRLGLVTGLGLCLLAARAHGLAILDGVHLDLDDSEGFAAQCRQGRDFGFDGKTLIHPKTIAVANQVFGPSAETLAWSRRIIAAHAAALEAGQGMAVVDGQLIENLHVAEAQHMVALADRITAAATAADCG